MRVWCDEDLCENRAGVWTPDLHAACLVESLIFRAAALPTVDSSLNGGGRRWIDFSWFMTATLIYFGNVIIWSIPFSFVIPCWNDISLMHIGVRRLCALDLTFSQTIHSIDLHKGGWDRYCYSIHFYFNLRNMHAGIHAAILLASFNPMQGASEYEESSSLFSYYSWIKCYQAMIVRIYYLNGQICLKLYH